ICMTANLPYEYGYWLHARRCIRADVQISNPAFLPQVRNAHDHDAAATRRKATVRVLALWSQRNTRRRRIVFRLTVRAPPARDKQSSLLYLSRRHLAPTQMQI